MELLDLLNHEEDIKKAIKFLLDSKFKESDWYQTKQRFTLLPDEKLIEISYCAQREHAIDWFFSKALWNKKRKPKSPLELVKVIEGIQCTPLIIYLLIVTDTLSEKKAESLKNAMIPIMTDKIANPSNNLTSKNIRFTEKRELLSIIDNKHWAEDIAKKLLEDNSSSEVVNFTV
jgi:hypothetical protein